MKVDIKFESAFSSSRPEYRVIILGAGKNTSGNIPSAMVSVDKKNRVLDWILNAFSILPEHDVCFVGGYKANIVEEIYPDIRFYFNSNWHSTGTIKSLSLVPLSSTMSIYVCYSDIVFRQDIIEKMEISNCDVVIAVDTDWKVRYKARSRKDLDNAEKLIIQDRTVVNFSKNLSTAIADAEFAGLLKIKGEAKICLEKAIKENRFSNKSNLPEIIMFLIQNGFSIDIVDVLGDWAELNEPQDLARFVLGTKAESLKRLKPLLRKGNIGEQVSFTQSQFSKNPEAVLSKIYDKFGNSRLIVRSSSFNEDNWIQSLAGVFKSVMDVPGDDAQKILSAIYEVFASYEPNLPEDQVLIQVMLKNVTISGVIMTRTPNLGAPYYVINFDDVSSRTDTITSGEGKNIRTVYLHHEGKLKSSLPSNFLNLIEVVKEIELLVGHDSLDIEFAITKDDLVHIMQIRPIAVADREQSIDDENISLAINEATEFFNNLQKSSPFLVGNSTILSNMSDWNPAEIIGAKPNRLAFSLYRYLISDEVWAIQRAENGFRDVRPHNLIVDILGHPYVDLRVCFNSFIPDNLSDDLAERLANYYLEYLSQNPALHDKVEFEVILTCLSFDFDHRIRKLSRSVFTEEDIEYIRSGLLEITKSTLLRNESDMTTILKMEERYELIINSELAPLERAYQLIEEIRRFGTPAFSHLARCAFIAFSFLKSLMKTQCISQKQFDDFLSTLNTVPSKMKSDAYKVRTKKLSWEDFVRKYGHLRPSSYDITSLCYANAPEDYLRPLIYESVLESSKNKTVWGKETCRAIGKMLGKHQIDLDPNRLEELLRAAIERREFSKFIFTKNLNASLESICEFGSKYGITREELASVRVKDLFQLRSANCENIGNLLKRLSEIGEEEFKLTQGITLPGQIVSEDDFVCIEQFKSEPNFITQKQIIAKVFPLDRHIAPEIDLSGKIVVIPNADPGYDWLFGRNIAGLVTMYGGVNSHMAIRVAEFELPAAIGVGEILFEKINQAETLDLDCKGRRIGIVS